MRLVTTVTVLLLHGGGFNGGDPATVEPLARDIRALGYSAVVVRYRELNPRGNVLDEIATVRRYAQRAKRRGPVVAYGVSAGGTLAAALAARGEVDGAVVAGAPTNLTNWICVSPYITTPRFWRDLGMNTADRREASPYYRLDGKQSPQLLLYGDIDPLVPIDQGLNYYRAASANQIDTRLTVMGLSPHGFPAPYRVQARRWIQARWPVRAPIKIKF